jgi:hypothetical protein
MFTFAYNVKIYSMILKNLKLFNVIDKTKTLNFFSKKTFTGFCTSHSKTLFSGFKNKENLKYFHITENTKKRIRNVPVNEITGNKLIDLKPSKGIVYFNDGLHFAYLIRKNGVYIMTSKGKSKKKVNDPLFYTSEMMQGFLYYDFFSDTSTCYINNVLDFKNNKDTLLMKERDYLLLLQKIYKESENGNNEKLDLYNEDYMLKWNNTKLCLQAFMFIFFAKVIDTKRISQENDDRTISEKLKNKKIREIEIIEVDTFYDENISVINPFSVNGHYRNQPFGKGRKETKMIYIDGFMKTGYNRTATKTKINK